MWGSATVGITLARLSAMLSRALLGSKLYPLTLREAAFGLTTADIDEAVEYGNLLRYGADPTGAVSSRTAVLRAVGCNDDVFAPAGDYLIEATTVLSTTRDLTFKGAGRDATAFLTTITDGSPVFRISGQWHDVGEFKVNSQSGALQNFVGLEAGDAAAPTSFVRSRLRVKVSNAAVGVKVRGWINNIDIFATLCTLGVYGREWNSCTGDVRTENCTQGYDLKTLYGTTLTNLLDENTFTAGTTTVASQVDDFQGLTIGSLYLESGSYATTCVVFASTTQSYGLSLLQIKSNPVPLDRAPPIVIDRVHGITVRGLVYAGGFKAGLHFTENAAGIDSGVICPPATAGGTDSTNRVQDNSKQLRRAQVWTGDAYLTHGLSTFDVVTKTGVTVTTETDNIVTGRRGLKLEATGGGAAHSLLIRRTCSVYPHVANLLGKTVKAFAWVYVPALPKFIDRTYQPGVELHFGGGGSVWAAMQRNMRAGCWNLIETPAIATPAGWLGGVGDYLEAVLHVSGNGAVVADAGYYIILDSLYFCPSTVSMLDIQRGNFEHVDLLGIRTDGVNLTVRSAAWHSTANPDSAVIPGDTMLLTGPAPAGYVGKVCTTPGAIGGTAVFKDFGAIVP